MKKTITIPAALLKRAREVCGTAGMTDSQLVSTCLEAGLATTEKAGPPDIRSTVAEIVRVLDRANLRQLSLILRIARGIVGEGVRA